MNKYEVPVYKELILGLNEQKKNLQGMIDDIDYDIDFYEGKIAEYLERRKEPQP